MFYNCTTKSHLLIIIIVHICIFCIFRKMEERLEEEHKIKEAAATQEASCMVVDD